MPTALMRADTAGLAALLNAIGDGITAIDRQGRMVYANDAAAELCGFPDATAMRAADLAEVRARFVVHRHDGTPLPPEEMPTRIALMGGTPPRDVLVRWRPRGGGPERWSLLNVSVLRDASGEVDLAITTFREVTDRVKEAERARLLGEVSRMLAEAGIETDRVLEAVARGLSEVVGDGCSIRTLSEDGRTHVHRATWHRDEAARSLALHPALTAPRPSDSGFFGALRSTGQPIVLPQVDVAAVAAQYEALGLGELVEKLAPRALAVFPLRGPAGVFGIVAVSRTLDERPYDENEILLVEEIVDRASLALENARLYAETRASLEARERLVEDLSRAVRFSEMFVGMLGHDLRNPLFAITSAAALARDHTTDERALSFLRRIVKGAGRMERMIEQLLDLTMIRLGDGIPLCPVRCDLAAIAGHTIEELGGCEALGVRVAVHGDPTGVWDADRLAQLTSNIVGNAVHHRVEGTPVTVEVHGLDEARVRLTVRNAGTIPAEELPTLFEPFQVGAGHRRTARSSGLGLGLFISQQVALAHGGTLRVESGAGTTELVVELPRAAAS